MRGLRFSLALLCSLLLGGVLASVAYGATTTVFKDGFESGSLTAWTNSGGTGQETVTSAAAHTGGYGLTLSGTSGQSEKVAKTLSVPLTDSTTEFWMRVDSASGITTVAEARDQANTGYEWVLEYDSTHQQLCFYPYNGAASTEILTGAGSAPMNTWLKVLIVYDATSSGGAELSINGHSPAAWSVAGSYARPDGLQRLQLWYNGAGSTDLDDVVVTTPDGTGVGLPVDKSPPAVTGTATQGQTLTATSGSWSGTPNKYSYAWQDCDSAGNNCQPISGASSNTYVLQASDAGQTVRAVVEARNSVGWSSSIRSVQTAEVTGLPPSNTQLPSISGTAQQGDQLTADPGQWSGQTPMSYSYAWSDGQSGQTITLGSSDVGKTLTVAVTATNHAGSAEATSAGVGPVTPSGLQSFAYWLGWEPNSFAESALPWSDLTRVTMFSAEVNTDASLNLTQNSLQLYNMPAWTAMLHQHGVQAFITLGDNTGSGGGAAWQDACSASEDQTLATNIVNYATSNGFDGIDLDIENGVTPLSQLEACVQQIANQAHAAGLLVSAEQDQSIWNSNPYSEVVPDINYLDSAVDEYYGYNPANDWNCGTGTPYGTCAYVAQLDGGTIRAGQLASKTLLGMATCCGAAQAAYSNLSTTSGTVDTSGSVTSVGLASALSAALPAGNVVVSDGGESHYEVFSTSGAAAGATSIPITGSVRGNGSFQFPAGSEVQSDYAGPWDCYNMAAYAHANGYQGSMDFALQSEYGAYNKSFPCLDQIALGLGLN